MKPNDNSVRNVLTYSQVTRIRELYKPHRHTATMLAEEFGVSKFTIYQIVYRKTWRNVRRYGTNLLFGSKPCNHTRTASEIPKKLKGVLPIAKDIKELNKWCSVASNRAMNDEVNPYKGDDENT